MHADSTPIASAEAYGLFIGASEFTDVEYWDQPSVAASAQALAEVFATGGVWNLPPERRRVLSGRVDKIEALDALEETAKQKTDLLLVYIGCHGNRPPPAPGLHLALSDARFFRPSTHLPFLEIKEILQESAARRKLLLLDCCFADDSYLGHVNDPELDVPGVWTIVATAHREPAIAAWRRTAFTAFAGALLEVLAEGVAYGPQPLTAQDAFGALRVRLLHNGKPVPGMHGSAGTMPLFRNEHPEAGMAAPTLERADLVLSDPATYARNVTSQASGRSVTAEAEERLEAFVREREAPDVAALVRAFVALNRLDLAAATTLSSAGVSDDAEAGALVHHLHSGSPLPPGLLFTSLEGLPGGRFAAVVGHLSADGCGDCERIAGELTAAASDSAWSTGKLAALLHGMPAAVSAPDTAEPAPDLRRGPRERFLDGMSLERLVDIAATLWAEGTGDGSPVTPGERLQAAAVVERAAGRATPREVLDLAARLTDQGFAELGVVLLESVATTANAPALAELLRLAGQDDCPGDQGEVLRTTLVRRRPPGFLAGLLRTVGADEGSAAHLLLAAALENGTIRDVSRMLLILRHHDWSDLETAQGVTDLLDRLGVDQFTEALVLLDRYGDQDAVRALLARVLGARNEDIADLIHRLSGLGHVRLVSAVVDRAAGRAPDSLLHLFMLLEEEGLRDEAADVLNASVRLAEPEVLADALDGFRAARAPDSGQLGRLLRALVRGGTVEQTYELALRARGRIADADRVIAAAVVEFWPVRRIEALAARFTVAAYPWLANDILRQAVVLSADRGTDGARTAALVLALRGMTDAKLRRDSTRELIARLVGHRDADQVMALVGRLFTARRYDEFRGVLEREVLNAFTWEEFERLPRVHRMTYLPAVLEIEMTALLDPALVPAVRVASVVRALKEAGTGHSDLRQLLGYVGRRRGLDPLDVISNLRTAGLGDEADAFREGGVRRRPVFLGD